MPSCSAMCCAGSSVFLRLCACVPPPPPCPSGASPLLLLLSPSVHFLSLFFLFFPSFLPPPLLPLSFSLFFFSSSLSRSTSLFPVDLSTDVLSEAGGRGGVNVTSLIIGAAKRVVRNNYELGHRAIVVDVARHAHRALRASFLLPSLAPTATSSRVQSIRAWPYRMKLPSSSS